MNKSTTVNSHEMELHKEIHLSFEDIVQHTQGKFPLLKAQLASHHIMHCTRCEAVWEQLIRNYKKSAAPQLQFWQRFLGI